MDQAHILLTLDKQKAQICWKIVTTAIIVFVFSYVFSVSLIGSGVGITALWWLIGVPTLMFLESRLFQNRIFVTIWQYRVYCGRLFLCSHTAYQSNNDAGAPTTTFFRILGSVQNSTGRDKRYST